MQEKRKGKPKKRWLDNIWDDMKEYELTEDMAQKSKSVAHEHKGRPITKCRRPIIDEKVTKRCQVTSDVGVQYAVLKGLRDSLNNSRTRFVDVEI